MSSKRMGKNSLYSLRIDSEIEDIVEINVGQEIGLQFIKREETLDLCLDNSEIKEIRDLLTIYLDNLK